MTFWNNIALTFKGGGGHIRPPLGRSHLGTYWGASFSDEAPFSYEAELRAAYLGNAIAQRAVRIVAEGVGGAPLSTGDDDALAKLIGAASAGQSLMETVAVHLLLHGNAYIQILSGSDGKPGELFALRPDRVTIEADERGWPAAYAYRAGENVTRIDACDEAGRVQIVHIKAFHPTDDHYGLGCLGAAAKAVAVHNAAAQWNRALLSNAARPSGALVFDPGEGQALSADQFDRVKSEMEASFSGSGNAGRPMLLEGGLKWQSMSMTPADMDFVALKDGAAREIALAFGVPPMLLGLPGDNSYANYKEANRALWRLTILPLAGKILDGLSDALIEWWPDMALHVNRDRVEALSEDRERLWNQISGADFLSPEEKREMLGIEKGANP